MDQSRVIEKLIEPSARELGYDLVRVRLQGGQRTVLQIMAERQDRRAMVVEDCARLSRRISAVLDEADPIAQDYTLEVSSPGIDRPLMKPADFERFAGHEVKIELETPMAGCKRFQGAIAKVESDRVALEIDANTVSFPLSQIRSAKLILTDRLIAAAQDEAASANLPSEAGNAPHIHV
jgi:ribosome maturation factor RimP